jgi:PEP-CTERM motif
MTNHRYSFLSGLLALTTILFGTAPIQATTIISNATADAFVTPGSDGSLANNNYGAAGKLGVAASGKPKGEFQSVLKFDLASTKTAFDTQFGIGQWTIDSITLQLTASAPNDPIFNAINAGQFTISWMQNDTWIEGTGTPGVPTSDGITWNTLPSFLGPSDENVGTFSFNGATSGATTYTLTLTSGLTADVLAGGVISLRTFAADSDVSYLPQSRTFNTASARPMLSVTAVPEPSSSALLLAGLLLLARKRLRRS